MLRTVFAPLAFATLIPAFQTGGAIAGAVDGPVAPPPPVEREFRAAWISPISDGSGGDWPSSPFISADSQRAELRALLDHAKAIGLNAVILHVRTAGDALYPSHLAPWSAFLTGRSGADPGYDPLAFAIEEAHARGLQLHAWFNPFRAMLPNFAGRAAESHVTRTHPEWIRRYGAQTWIDPGEPAARQAILDAILEVVKRYDVDGVHIDDYFYPYRETETVTRRVRRKRITVTRDLEFPDDATWRRYGRRAGWTSRADWRRDNVNQFVRAMYTEVKREKPWVLVGVSPFGIWRSGTPNGITGLDAYGEIYADSRLWLAKGWMDYVAPQLYWALGGTEDRFTVLERWWRAQNPLGRYVWPGLATMHLRSGHWDVREIDSQIEAIREARVGTTDVPGHIHFRLGALSTGMEMNGFGLRDAVYTNLALVPAFPWLAHGMPATPHVSRADSATAGPRSLLVWAADSVPVAWWLVQQQGSDGRWSTTLRHAGLGPNLITMTDSLTRVVAIRAIDRVGQESAPALFTLITTPLPSPGPFRLFPIDSLGLVTH